MSDFFLSILKMSLTASYVMLAVIVVRLLLKKAPKIFSYALWAVVLFRLVCPYTFESPMSLLPDRSETIPVEYDVVYHQTPAIVTDTETVPDLADQSIQSNLPSNQSASVYHLGFLEIGTIIWVMGIFVLLLYGVISYGRLKHKLSIATLVNDNIYETDLIKTPFVLGLTKPRIYIPSNLTENELCYIIKHEKAHIKRYDYIIKPIAFMVLILHWFNPLAWISYFLMVKDMELSCDESVMKHSDSDIRVNYSNSLLSLSIKQSGLISVLAFGEVNVKSRIKNVLNYKKPAFWVISVAVIIVVTIAIGLISNPSSGEAFDRKRSEPLTALGVISSDRLSDTVNILIKESDSAEQTVVSSKNTRNEITRLIRDLRCNNKETREFSSQYRNEKIRLDLYGSSTSDLITIYISQNFTHLYVNNYDKSLYLCQISNSKEMLKEFKDIMHAVNNKDPKADPDAIVKRIYLDSPDKVYELYKKAVIENDYDTIVALHSRWFPTPDGHMVQEYMKVNDIKLLNTEISENKAVYSLEYDVAESSGSNLKKDISQVWLEMKNQEAGWNVYALYYSDPSEEMKGWGESVSRGRIDYLLTAIVSLVSDSSAPGTYIEAHQKQYDEIVSMGEDALPYLTEILDKEEKGLKGNIVTLICTDIVKNMRGNGENSSGTQQNIDKALISIDKWNEKMGYNLSNITPATPEAPQAGFTDEEVASARAVVEEYFRAVAAKDDAAILKTLTPVHHHPNEVLYGDETCTLLSIDYDEADLNRYSYLESGRGRVNGTELENVIVFKVNFNVDYPQGIQGSFNQGNYTNWNMILIRDNRNSPWLIDDQGY